MSARRPDLGHSGHPGERIKGDRQLRSDKSSVRLGVARSWKYLIMSIKLPLGS